MRSGWSGEEKIWEQRQIGMNKNRRALLMYNIGRRSDSGSLDAINAGAEGHVAMYDEMRPCVAWENWDAINIP